MKKCIMVSYEEEKLLALRMYAEQRGASVEEELAQAAEAMYQKIVPANVRAFVDMKVESQKPKKKERGASASAVGDGQGLVRTGFLKILRIFGGFIPALSSQPEPPERALSGRT